MNQENRDQRAQPANEAPGLPPDAPPLSGRVAVIAIVVLLILAVVLAIGGIVPRVRAAHQVKKRDRCARCARRDRAPTDARQDWAGNYSARQHLRLQRCVALRAYRRLSQQVVFRYRRAREARASCWQSSAHPGSGQATASGACRSDHGGSERRSGQDQLHPLPGTAHAKRRFKTRHGYICQPGGIHQLRGQVRPGQCAAPGGAAIVRKDLCPLQWSHHCPQCRRRSADQLAGAARRLFRISAINVLRVYVNVPQIYSQAAVPGTHSAAYPFRISRPDVHRQSWCARRERSIPARARCW